MTNDRPYISTYEPDEHGVEQLVYRTMTDDEYTQWQADQEAAEQIEQSTLERAWVALRMKRDRWLTQTDSFFVSPMPSDFPADKIESFDANRDGWLAFRQALRDLPANTADPRDVDWPTPPPAPVVHLT